MEPPHENGRQIRLRNVLLSVTLFGVAFALARTYVQLMSTPYALVALASEIGSVASFGAAMGAIFGRILAGITVALVVFAGLVVGATTHPLLFVGVLAVAMSAYVAFRRKR